MVGGVQTSFILEIEHSPLEVIGSLAGQTRHPAVALVAAQVALHALAGNGGRLALDRVGFSGPEADAGPGLFGEVLGEHKGLIRYTVGQR